MKLYRSQDVLSDGRKRRLRPAVVITVLAVIQPTARRIDRLDTPSWQSGELNRPTLPGAQVDKGEEELVVAEETGDPLHLIGRVQRNQTLFVTLRNRGLMPDRIQPVVQAMSSVFDFRRSRPGDRYEARLDLDGNILEFRYQTSPEDIFAARLVGDQYVAERVEVPKEIRLARIDGKVTSSLFHAFGALGEKTEAAQRFMDLFAFDFDFGSDSKQGDRFRLIIEKVFLDGEFYKYGEILAAEYSTSEKTFQAFYFDRDGAGGDEGEYYDAEGYALRRKFMLTPVRNAKFTSPFDRKRMHPILKRVRPHLGVDWAAPTGTPVMAAADGVVQFAGWKGGNGNLVVIKHDDAYTTVYAHLHRFARGMKKGKEVKQQQVIGYVGSTGLSTAPHLHYGLKKNGVYMDPMKLDTSRGDQLPRRELARFHERRKMLQGMLDGTKALVQPGEDTDSKTAASDAERSGDEDSGTRDETSGTRDETP